MNFIANESAQKLRGGYYTPPDIAAFLCRWVMEIRPKSILEPSCGNGAFFAALGMIRAKGISSVFGCETEETEITRAKSRLNVLPDTAGQIHHGDFLEWFLSEQLFQPQFDAVIGNPPFIRYQYLDSIQQHRAAAVFDRAGLPFTKHTNAWVPFVLASLALLRPGGRLAMVIPSELLHVLHAGPLRRYLLKHCSRILVLDPDDLLFPEALQGVVLLMAEKRSGCGRTLAEVCIQRMPQRNAVAKHPSEFHLNGEFIKGETLEHKWVVGLLSRSERALLNSLRTRPSIQSFSHLATVDVGIVTGANKFFLVSDEVVEQFQLSDFAHPMFGRSDHVRGVIYDAASHRENQRLGLASNFLWFDGVEHHQLADPVKRYIRWGEEQGLPSRYKCRIRSPWYTVPSVYQAPVGMLKRSHHFPRLVLNRAKAFTTDTAYRIALKGSVTAPQLVTGFVNSLTALTAELEGRHYGGGVLELVPSEIEKLLVPTVVTTAAQLNTLDQNIRRGIPAEDMFEEQDKSILTAVGCTAKDIHTLAGAWNRLRSRRQRTSGEDQNQDVED